MHIPIRFAGYLNILVFVMVSCSSPEPEQKRELGHLLPDSTPSKDSIFVDTLSELRFPVNDTLDQLAAIIAAECSESSLFPKITSSMVYQSYRQEFSKRWLGFDSTRVNRLMQFQDSVLSKIVSDNSTLFYPFSGPDYLYAGRFFPKSEDDV